MTTRQFIEIMAPFLLLFIGSVFGITKWLGSVLINTFTKLIEELKHEINDISKKLEGTKEWGIKHTERINALCQRVAELDGEMKIVKNELHKIKERHARNHPDDRFD